MNFIEVCAGCGGLSTGLKNAGFTPLFISDIDKNCVETLKLNNDNANYIHCEDMKTTLEKINKQLWEERRKIAQGPQLKSGI